MKYAEEAVPAVVSDFDDLLASYYPAENKGHIPLEMNWCLYRTLYDQEACRIFTARNEYSLVAGVIYLLVHHPHHKSTLVAEGDILCVRPHYRGKGVGGALLEYAETALRIHGVEEIIHRSKHIYDAKPIYLSHGYEAVETVYRKKVA